MQKAMLACVDITKPSFTLSTKQKMSARKFLMRWLCDMANSVIGKQRELLEYHHLIANPNTKSTWSHSYGNGSGIWHREWHTTDSGILWYWMDMCTVT